MTARYERRAFVACVEIFYLLVLFALALLYFPPVGPALHVSLPASFGSLPVGVPWFGALGAVIISLSGVFDHRNDWDPTWALWHFTRPLIGISLAIIAWLTFQAGILAVGSVPGPPGGATATQAVTAPTNLLYYLIAFVVGYREAVFRELIKRVSDVILTPSGGAGAGSAPPVVTSLKPASGHILGGDEVTISGSSLSGTTGVTFGGIAAPAVRINSDVEISVTTPPGGLGPVTVTVTTSAGKANCGPFTYGAR
ncbi:MAG TPA: IPT/TIG domain-containing protein [Candidatus Cybelea sp.]